VWVATAAVLGSCPSLGWAAESAAAESAPATELTEGNLEAWLSREPEQVDASDSDDDLAPPPLPPRRHGLVIEGSAGALGHLGNMREVSPVAPWFRLQVGYELFDWLMLFGQGDVAFSSTSFAQRPPDKRSYSLFGFGAGARLQWQAFSAVGFFLQADGGFASVDEDVLATYGYPDADRLRPYSGGSIGVDWFQLSPHYALSVSGGARDYFQSFERVYGTRPPLVWLGSVAIRYTF
jgi:hypothetical protein